MEKYSTDELSEALNMISSTIDKCEKIQLKFAEGTSQHTLLKNRIKALYVSKSLLKNENIMEKYTKGELTDALRPISSIISKCEKAQQKHIEGTIHHTLFQNMIKAMHISKSFIMDEISRRG